MIDATDRKILSILQADARTSNAEIARQLDMAPSATFERIRKLESRGIIVGYEGRLSPKALGLGLLCFIFVRSDEAAGALSTGRALAEVPEVQEVHHVAGEDCYLVKVRCADTDDLARILRERLGRIPTIRSTRSTIVLGTLKESAALMLPGEEALEASDAA
jgi:Lrp/AsnC family leucine-responsive transcriptional regulator